MRNIIILILLSSLTLSAQTINFTYDARGNILTETNNGNLVDTLQVKTRAFLVGPYNPGTGLMNDQLRTKNLIPTMEPYSALGYTFLNGGGETVNAGVFTVSGQDAIVDWVVVELRDQYDRAKIISSRAALIQRDGDLVDIDGMSAVKLAKACKGAYFIGIRHRNHLSVMNLYPHAITVMLPLDTLNFTLIDTPTYGTNAQKNIGSGLMVMWGGNANGNNTVRATGPPGINDYTNILNTLGAPTTIQNNVYKRQDLNMDGVLRVTGPPSINDYTTLLNIIGSPTTIITATF